MADLAFQFDAFDGAPATPQADAAEKTLIRELCEGRESAYEALIQRFERPVYSLAARLTDDPADTADVVQEVFLKVFRSIGSFRGDCSLKTWIYRIAVNESRNQLRWFLRHRHKEVGMEQPAENRDDEHGPMDWMADKGPSPLEVAVDHETREMVEQALAQVTPTYRAALVLREVEGLSYDEIAQILEVTLGTVKSRIVRGREELRERMARRMKAPRAAAWKPRDVMAGG